MLCWFEVHRTGPYTLPLTVLALFRKGTSGIRRGGSPQRLADADDIDPESKCKHKGLVRIAFVTG